VIKGVSASLSNFAVAFASDITTINATLPYADDAEMGALQAYLGTVPTIQPTTAVNSSEVVLELDFTLAGESCSNGGMVDLVIPRTVSTLCFGDDCRPVLCPLGENANPLDFSSVSFAPSNIDFLFSNGTECVIAQPTFWLEWITFYFENSSFVDPDTFYYVDSDIDGLSNIVEYYGLDLASFYVDIEGDVEDTNETSRVRNLQDGNITFPDAGTNPTNPDTDGDLLTDGFELFFTLDPKTPNDIMADTDGDSLSDFDEQRLRTNPKKRDSDGDGFSDAVEISRGSNPLKNKRVPGNTTVTIPITLSVGDPSTSESERYIMTVGTIEHASPEFGVVRSATYDFRPGVYQVRVRHLDTNLDSPDYDYEARISWLNVEGFTVEVSDPQDLLGTHFGSSFDRTVGRVATLTITSTAVSELCNYSTCVECNGDTNCEWDETTRFCTEFDGLLGFLRDTPADCACAKCRAWAAPELADRGWIDATPMCPCSVTSVSSKLEWLAVDAINNPDGVGWRNDMACNPNWECRYHPNAKGCIRSGGNQCCYDTGNAYIPAGTRDAGTPDRYTDIVRHTLFDVRPYEHCCNECEEADACSLYIGTPDGSVMGARSDHRGCFAG